MEMIFNNLKAYDFELSTGTGIGELETEELKGYIESIAFESEQEVDLLIETPGMLGTPILNLKTPSRYFTPRISPTDSEGSRFNYGSQKIAILGSLIIRIKGSVGKMARLRVILTEN